MRRLTPFLQQGNINPSRIIQFPFDDINTFSWGEKAFRIFVNANNNSGIEDGKSWDTAFTTIQKAIDSLPDDLMYFNAFILVAGGNYSLPSIRTKKNGILFFEYIGDTWNNLNDPDFRTLGRTFSSSPALLQQSSAVELSGRNIEIHFRSRTQGWNLVYNGWRVKIMPNSNFPNAFTISGDMFALITNMVLDASDSTYTNFKSLFRIINPSSSLCGLNIETFSVIGRGNDPTDDWSGSISISDNTEVIRLNIGVSFNFGWASGKSSPNSKKFVFNNIKKFFTMHPVATTVVPRMNIDLSSIDFTAGETGQTKIKISINSYHFGGKLKIDDNMVDLTDNSGKIGELNKTTAGTVTYYIGKGMKFNNTVPIFSTNNSVPADSIIANKDVTFWIDESSNKLMFKLKYNNGTVKSGEINLL
ncbi:MAG: hypothetical protein KGZ42_09035 [Melioribacter sp.]|nr:hypothetical protein [Melioribacter sp.]